MSEASQEPINSLAALPGGIGAYLSTLVQMLDWIARAKQPTYEDFAKWIMAQYQVRRAMVNSYGQVIVRLNVVKKVSGNRLELTYFGEQLLSADSQDRARLLSELLLTRYTAAREVLSIYAHATEAIHLDTVIQLVGPHFPRWTSSTQFDERIHWLLSADCLQRVGGRYHEVSALGREMAERFPPGIDLDFDKIPSSPSAETPLMDERSLDKLPEEITAPPALLSALAHELTRASTGSDSKAFERAIVRAFKFLGFTVVYYGDSGETDLVLIASIGPYSYRVIVDAKARQNGKLESVEVYTLQDHLRRHEANYAVVVAGEFAGGKVARHAQDNGIVLLSVPVLIQWMEKHAKTHLNLDDYRVMFTTPGILHDLPPELLRIADQRQKWPQLVVDLMELVHETYEHGLSLKLPRNQLFTMLATRLREVRYSEGDVQAAIDLLTHPAFPCAVGEGETGISLAMTRRTFAQALRSFADLIDGEDVGE